MNIGSRKKTTLSSRQACFVISHSLGDFNDKNIHNHRLYIYLSIYIYITQSVSGHLGDFNDKNIHNHRLYIYIYIYIFITQSVSGHF